MPGFDPKDPRQVASLLVFMDCNADEIVDTLAYGHGMDRVTAVNVVADLLRLRLDGLDGDSPEIVEERLRAVASEWDLTASMHATDA